jgi:hypothetical protein
MAARTPLIMVVTKEDMRRSRDTVQCRQVLKEKEV